MKQFFLIAALASASFLQAQTVSPQVKLSKGQLYEQVSEIKANMSQDMMGQSMEFVIVTTSTNHFNVKDASASNYTVTNTTKRIKMNMSGMGQEQQFDTDKPDDMSGPMGAGFKDRVGAAKEYIIDTKGIITKMLDTSAKKQDAAGMSGMVNGIAQTLEKEGGRFALFANIPPKGAKVGETWIDSVTGTAGGTKNIATYTLKSVTGNVGVITLSSATTMEQDVEQQSMAMHLSMKGTTTGEYQFDTATGLISEVNATTKADGTIEVMGQTVPMKVENTIKTVLTKK